jgi:hypothetical protein
LELKDVAMRFRTIAVTAAALVALGASQALAQYPPPLGSISASPSNPNPGLNSDTSVTVTVNSDAGVPAGSAACGATIASQPGTDATLSPSNFVTDAAGQATLILHTGSAPGQVTIAVTCGQLSANTVVNVGASPDDVPRPPDTGAGAATGQSGGSSPLPWALAAAVGITGGAAFLATTRRRSR